MHLRRFFSYAGLSALLIGPAFAFNNADVIKMKQADFSEQTILLSIAKEPADYDTSTDGLIALKKAGLSEAVIQKIIEKQRETQAAAATPASAAVAPAAAPEEPNFAAQDFPSIAPAVIDPVAGQDYFLRSTLHVEDGKYIATNYARGELVPINTPVHLESISGSKIVLKRVDNGARIKVENVDKYTHKSSAELAKLLLSAEKTPLEKLPEALANFIRSGDMRKGMTKEQVLMARGYPPAHETPSTDADRWTYWSSRFIKQTVVFTNGRLTDGRGIY